MAINEIPIEPDLTTQRAEVESLARRAAAAGCDWARADLELFYGECVETQRTNTALLPAVISYWRERFASAAADPGQRRPPFLPLIEARQILANAQVRLQNLARRDPGRVREVMARFEAAPGDRERALLLTSAEAAATMLPPGLVLNESPEPPIAEAAALLQRLRGAGIMLSLTPAGEIAVNGMLSESQRDRIRTLRAEIVGLLGRPTETL